MKSIPNWIIAVSALTLIACSASRKGASLSTADKKALKEARKMVAKKDTNAYVLLLTSKGNMVLKLYNQTPLHRDNFLSKVKAGFYDSLLFHRVIDSFMIQGGDPDSKYAAAGKMLGAGGAPGGRIPAEFRTAQGIYHKRGALAAARDQNPEKASSNCQFYIVQRKAWRPGELDSNMQRRGITINDEQRKLYTTIGGTPHLDGGYTVFGEVISGMEIADGIAASKKDAANRPVQDVRMRMLMVYEPAKKK
jgi:peptidyl-prolyl cis-trans isomerase B (cyclophilin B)